jgi:outer membrane protein insertion porin family
VGSANTVRGYYPSEARLGRKKLLLNVEYRYTFNEVFQGVGFFDFGNAWDEGAPPFGDFISGKGFGIRLNTPLGPLRLDYGIGAGKNFGEGIIHFSMGQAF